MPLIGIRELREKTSEVIRRVREERAEYIITHQGRPVAILLPVSSEVIEDAAMKAGKEAIADAWGAYTRLAEALRRDWPERQDSRDALDAIRR
jgi:prevent-host-death family protein